MLQSLPYQFRGSGQVAAGKPLPTVVYASLVRRIGATLAARQGFGEPYRGRVNTHRVLDLTGIATRHGDGERQASGLAMGEHAPVALGQPVEGEREAAQAVITIGVGAGQVDDQIGACQVESGVQPFVQAQQVGGVGAAIRVKRL